MNHLQKVGYTTGVFDLFHIGHLNIFRQARQNCSHLIVGVTIDELVKERKKQTPIIPFTERFEIIKSIKYVDEVVIEDNLDKWVAWEKYKFNIIFKGDDWKGTQLWNKYEELFKAVNVQVMYFPYTSHTSSSLLREILNKLQVT
jgi:glycerol-3-phosphate cytidylyltransferase